jgi:beta-phosphoglucomutase-like phosphatase (HAD superfamily)
VLVDAALDRLGRHRFDVTVAGDEVRHGKPDPECYQLACARLGVPADRTVVVEDAPAGVVAAEAAGCIAVAIPTIAHIAPTAHRPVLTSIGALDAEWLLALPERLTTTDG